MDKSKWKGKIQMNNKCLYFFLRDKDDEIGPAGSPYYCGEGSEERPYAKHKVPMPKDTKNIFIKRFNLPKNKSLSLERKWCDQLGLASQGGLLLNNHPGGTYPPNHTGMKRRPETVTKLKKSLKLRHKNPTKKMLLGRKKISRTNKKKGIKPPPINKLPLQIRISMSKKMSISAKKDRAKRKLLGTFKGFEKGYVPWNKGIKYDTR